MRILFHQTLSVETGGLACTYNTPPQSYQSSLSAKTKVKILVVRMYEIDAITPLHTHTSTQRLLYPCGHVNKQEYTHSLTFPPSEENGTKGGAAKTGSGRPGIQSKGWPGLGVSTLGSRGHLQDTVFLDLPLSSILPRPSSPPTPFLRPIPSTHQPGREVSRRLQPGSPTLSRVTFCRSRTRGRGQGEGRQPEGVKDEAPGEEGGRRRWRRLSARVPCSQRCHYCAPRPPPRPASATRPGDAGGGERSPGSPRADAHLPPRGNTSKPKAAVAPGRDRDGREEEGGEGRDDYEICKSIVLLSTRHCPTHTL